MPNTVDAGVAALFDGRSSRARGLGGLLFVVMMFSVGGKGLTIFCRLIFLSLGRLDLWIGEIIFYPTLDLLHSKLYSNRMAFLVLI